MLNLMILGARRSATTSLGYYLMEHPEVYHVTYKDFEAIGGLKVNYPYNIPFSALASRESVLDLYRAVTPRRPRGKKRRRLRYILNRAVYAIYYPHILFNLAEHLPGLKILMSLRDPVDSLYSVYCKRVQEKKSSGTFEEAIMHAKDLAREPASLDPSNLATRQATRSVYYPGIDMLYRLFPAEQIHIVSFEDLTRRTEATMQGICRFLEIDETYRFSRLAVKRGATEKPAPMRAETRRWLEAFFEPHNRKLFELLGWPADTWGVTPR